MQQEISNRQEDNVGSRVSALKSRLSAKKNAATLLFSDITIRLSEEYGAVNPLESQ